MRGILKRVFENGSLKKLKFSSVDIDRQQNFTMCPDKTSFAHGTTKTDQLKCFFCQAELKKQIQSLLLKCDFESELKPFLCSQT